MENAEKVPLPWYMKHTRPWKKIKENSEGQMTATVGTLGYHQPVNGI